jgi:hypothetical protein
VAEGSVGTVSRRRRNVRTNVDMFTDATAASICAATSADKTGEPNVPSGSSRAWRTDTMAFSMAATTDDDGSGRAATSTTRSHISATNAGSASALVNGTNGADPEPMDVEEAATRPDEENATEAGGTTTAGEETAKVNAGTAGGLEDSSA